MNQLKERPILFNAEMVRAILDGRKTQTRRLVKPQPAPHLKWAGWIVESSNRLTEGMACWADDLISKREFQNSPCPLGKHGDRLWVRETFFVNHWDCVTYEDYQKLQEQLGKAEEVISLYMDLYASQKARQYFKEKENT